MRKPSNGGVRLNKQRYLAELRRLLVFMTEEDREEAVRRYGAMFDDAGPEGEASLVEKLGSPTKAAIGLSRGYEPGKINVAAPVVTPKRPEKKTSLGEDGLPEFHLPGMEDDGEEEDAIALAEEPSEAGLPRRVAMPRTVVAREEPWREPSVPAKAVTRIERTMSLWLGIPLFILVFVALGLPVAAVFLAVMIVLLAPGCALLFAAWLVFVGGLWSTAYMSDAILLFGAALIVAAAGLLVLWCGVWLDVKLATVYGKGLGWIAGELLGRKVTVDE